MTSRERTLNDVLEDEYRSKPSSEDKESECIDVGREESLQVLVDRIIENGVQ